MYQLQIYYADIPEIAQLSKGIPAEINIFVYCNNNPTNTSDPNRKIAVSLGLRGLYKKGVWIMILLISLLLLFSNFISFYTYNLNHIEKRMTNREKHSKNNNLFNRLLFLDSWNISNKIYWILNFFNIIIATIGIICFLTNLLYKNNYLEEIIGTILLIVLVIVAFFAILSKLIINIKDNNSAFKKIFLILILILYLVGIYFIIKTNMFSTTI